jgi:hypothetical protein
MKRTKEPTADANWGYGYAVSEGTPNMIIGNILTLVEVLGLTDKQEQPFKDLIRQRVWDAFNEGITLLPETHSKLRTDYYENYDHARATNTAPASV